MDHLANLHPCPQCGSHLLKAVAAKCADLGNIFDDMAFYYEKMQLTSTPPLSLWNAGEHQQCAS